MTMASGDILLSAGVRNNLLALQSTADLISRTQTRLATGKKVNSALDDPFAFFTADAFKTRAADLSFLLSNMDIAVKALDAADKGISQIKGLVESAEAAARQALSSERTTAGLNGTVGSLTSSVTFLVGGSNFTLFVGDGTTTTTFTANASSTMSLQTIIDGINNASNFKIKASLNDAGQLLLEATGTNTIIFTGSAASGSGTNTAVALGLSQTSVAAGTINSTRSSLATQFDNLRTQINGLASDASFNGTSLLNLESLKVTFNETQSTSLTINGVNATAAGLAITGTTNTWQTNFDISASITLTQAAVVTLKNYATTFASNNQIVLSRQEFTKGLISSLESGSEALVLADTNEEGANLLALQTRQQLSSTALALSAQNDQAILRLFG
jgi:flagellin